MGAFRPVPAIPAAAPPSPVDEAWLAGIVARATPLHERLARLAHAHPRPAGVACPAASHHPPGAVNDVIRRPGAVHPSDVIAPPGAVHLPNEVDGYDAVHPSDVIGQRGPGHLPSAVDGLDAVHPSDVIGQRGAVHLPNAVDEIDAVHPTDVIGQRGAGHLPNAVDGIDAVHPTDVIAADGVHLPNEGDGIDGVHPSAAVHRPLAVAVDGDAAVDERLARWRDLVARGDDARWARRLAWDGWSEAAVRHALRPIDPTADGAPEWVDVLREAMLIGPSLAAPATSPHAYADALAGFAAVAEARLAVLHPELDDVSAHVREQFRDALMRTLSELGQRALHAVHTAEGGGYVAFMAGMRAGGLPAFLREHAVLARLLSLAALRWARATAEVLGRLEEDRAELETAFNAGRPLGGVVHAWPALSDAHHGGRTVCALAFENGPRIVYKPRGLGMERAFHELARWMNARGLPHPVRAAAVVSRGTHGWMEFIVGAPCPPAARESRARRAGALLCLMHLLGGEDLHAENVVPAGEDAVLVDLEVLLRPATPHEGLGDAAYLDAWEHVRDSVLATSLLPHLLPWPDGTAQRTGGFSELIEDRSDATAVADGYRDAYGWIAEHRAALLAADGPLAAFRHESVRILLRPTAVYGSLLRRCQSARFLRDGADRGTELDILTRPALKLPARHRLWPAFADERRQMEEMDVPAFRVDADGTALHTTCSGSIEGYATESGWHRLVRRLGEMDGAEMRRQLHFIRLTTAPAGILPSAFPLDGAAGDASEPADVLRAAVDGIAARLRALAAGDGAAPRWMELRGGEGGGLIPVQAGLGHGAAGIALFFAALYRVDGRPEDAAFARAAFRPVLAAILTPETDRGDDGVGRMGGTEGLGMASGAGGLVWALVRASRWLGDGEMMDAARAAARLITIGAIAEDAALDVFGGSAGAMLGLLALHAATGDGDALARAEACGRRLLEARVACPRTGLRAWPGPEGEPLAGFGHGAAGVAHALLRLHARTGDAAVLHAAREAWAWERTLHQAAAPLWPARLAGSDIRGWCRGAVGLGLGRAAAVHGPLGDDARADLHAALATVRAEPLPLPHACCGEPGRAELLLAAGHAAEARAAGAAMVRRAHRRSTWSSGTLDDAFSPGFLRGLAGIGYTLLRLRADDRLPSALLLD